MRRILIVKDANGKYALQIKSNEKIISTTGFIYDDIFSYENKLDDYSQEDIFLVTLSGLQGILDGWTMEMIIEPVYVNITINVHHTTFVFICVSEDDKLYLMNKQGNRVFRDPFNRFIHYGHFKDSNNYLYMYENLTDLGTGEFDSEIGIVTIDGHPIIAQSNKYQFIFKRIGEMIVMTRRPEEGYEPPEPVEIDYTKISKDYMEYVDYQRSIEDGATQTDKYDIYSSYGELLFENVDNYEFLRV